MSYYVKISVDEDTLRERYNEAVAGEANPEPFNLRDQIKGEFGWLEQSGISLLELSEKEE